jgi:hypothetical protein
MYIVSILVRTDTNAQLEMYELFRCNLHLANTLLPNQIASLNDVARRHAVIVVSSETSAVVNHVTRALLVQVNRAPCM